MDDIPEDIRQYVNENGLQFDLVALRSPVVQRMLRLRIQHPEWKTQRLVCHQIERYPGRHWRHWQE